MEAEEMTNADFHKILVELIVHFIDHEGTDYLGILDEPHLPYFKRLTAEEQEILLAARDEARKQVGWGGGHYTK